LLADIVADFTLRCGFPDVPANEPGVQLMVS
jgi:hypothetical protein